jgi:hypothetical protein
VTEVIDPDPYNCCPWDNCCCDCTC